jgi:hypothetical protein
MAEPTRVRIRFPVGSEAVESEGIWAEHVHDDRFRVLNIPFLAFGVALDDVIVAAWSAEYGEPQFVRVDTHSGNSAYRILVRPDADPSVAEHGWRQLEALGCGREIGTSERYWAIHAPRTVDRGALDVILEAGIAARTWWVEDGHVHPIDAQPRH